MQPVRARSRERQKAVCLVETESREKSPSFVCLCAALAAQRNLLVRLWCSQLELHFCEPESLKTCWFTRSVHVRCDQMIVVLYLHLFVGNNSKFQTKSVHALQKHIFDPIERVKIGDFRGEKKSSSRCTKSVSLPAKNPFSPAYTHKYRPYTPPVTTKLHRPNIFYRLAYDVDSSQPCDRPCTAWVDRHTGRRARDRRSGPCACMRCTEYVMYTAENVCARPRACVCAM